MSRFNRTSAARWSAFLITAFVCACSDQPEPTSPIRGPTYTLEALTPTSVTATVGSIVDPAPTVKVIGRDGTPQRGVEVFFDVSSEDEFKRIAVVTGYDGVAKIRWVLGTSAGENRVAAHVADGIEVVFTANALAGPFARIDNIFGSGQYGFPGTAVKGITVQTVDEFGNGVPGIIVSFVVTAGGGTVANPVVTSGLSGLAQSGPWVLGGEGPNIVVASASGISSLPITSVAVPRPAASITATYNLGTVEAMPASSGAYVDSSHQYQIVRGDMAGDHVEFSWFVDGPDNNTYFGYDRVTP